MESSRRARRRPGRLPRLVLSTLLAVALPGVALGQVVAQDAGGGPPPVSALAPDRISDAADAGSPVAPVQSAPPTGSSIDFVRRSLAANGQLLAARLDVSRARARLRQAGLRPNPSVDFEQKTGQFTGAAGESQTSVGVAVPLELFGQRGRRIDLAEAEIAAAEAEIAERERQLASEVRMRYAEALAAQRELELLGALGAIDVETARFVAVRVTEGESAPLEHRLLEVEIDRLGSRRAVVEGRLQAALLDLGSLVGAPMTERVTLAEDIARVGWSGAPASLDDAIAIALRTRPDLELARLEERVAEAGLRLVRAQTAPGVTVFGRFSIEKSVFDETPVGVIRDRDRTLAFGVSISLPIFNRNQGARAEAETAIAQSRRRREFTEQRIRAEVSSAFARLRAADAAVAIFERGVITRSNENLRAIRGAYQVGAFRITELLSEQRRYVDTQREYIETLGERYRALADLQTALGLAAPFGERQPAATPDITKAAPVGYPGLPDPAPAPSDARSEATLGRLPIAIDGGEERPVAAPKRTAKKSPDRGPRS